MKGGRTLHLKGRFSKINEPEVPLAWGHSGLVWALFFTYWKIEQLADLEGRWYIGPKIRQIGQNGLCMLDGISKSAGCFIFQYVGDEVWMGPE